MFQPSGGQHGRLVGSDFHGDSVWGLADLSISSASSPPMDQATYNQFESLGLLSARSDPLPATHPSSAYSSSDSFPGLHATAGGANLEDLLGYVLMEHMMQHKELLDLKRIQMMHQGHHEQGHHARMPPLLSEASAAVDPLGYSSALGLMAGGMSPDHAALGLSAPIGSMHRPAAAYEGVQLRKSDGDVLLSGYNINPPPNLPGILSQSPASAPTPHLSGVPMQSPQMNAAFSTKFQKPQAQTYHPVPYPHHTHGGPSLAPTNSYAARGPQRHIASPAIQAPAPIPALATQPAPTLMPPAGSDLAGTPAPAPKRPGSTGVFIPLKGEVKVKPKKAQAGKERDGKDTTPPPAPSSPSSSPGPGIKKGTPSARAKRTAAGLETGVGDSAQAAAA